MMPPGGAGNRARFDAVLFDLDGTLLDTIDDIMASMNAVLAVNGLPLHGPDAYRRFVGDGVEELVRRALPASRADSAGTGALVADYRREYARRWRDHSRPYPGVPELLARLQAKGVRLGVLSNKTDAFVSEMVSALLDRRAFTCLAGARPGIPLKPDPAPALAAARDLGVAPDRTLFVGDSDIDMQTARAAGMAAAAALWGFRPEAELRRAGARFLLARPLDVLSLWD